MKIRSFYVGNDCPSTMDRGAALDPARSRADVGQWVRDYHATYTTRRWGVHVLRPGVSWLSRRGGQMWVKWVEP